MISITLEAIIKESQKDEIGWWYRSPEGIHRSRSEFIYIMTTDEDFFIDKYIYFHQIRSLKIKTEII